MIQHFHRLDITEHDEILYEMGIKEKEHEIHVLDVIKDERWLPAFERGFSWGIGTSLNDVNLNKKHPISESDQYCKGYKKTESYNRSISLNAGHNSNVRIK